MVEMKITAEPGKSTIIATGVFDAPRQIVWEACTDPELVSQWWGPKSFKTTVEKMDARPGGLWRIVQRDAEGNEYAFRGFSTRLRSPSGLSTPSSTKPCRAMSCLRRIRSRTSKTGRG